MLKKFIRRFRMWLERRRSRRHGLTGTVFPPVHPQALARRDLAVGLGIGAAALLSQPRGALADTLFTAFSFAATGGTANQTMPARLGQIRNVMDFIGCDPTGATDSSAAFQAAINAAGTPSCGRVFVPPGQYKILNPVLLPTNTGAGSTLPSITIEGCGNATAIQANCPGFAFDRTQGGPAAGGIFVKNLTINNVNSPANLTVVSGSYNAGTGLVTLVMSGSVGATVGNWVTVYGLGGTGSVPFCNGVFQAAAGTTGSTLTYTIQIGLTLTIASGQGFAITTVISSGNYSSSTIAITSGTYISSNGQISLILPSGHGFVPGRLVTLSALTGTGANLGALNGTWSVFLVNGNVVQLLGPAGQGTITISGGTLTFGLVTLTTSAGIGAVDGSWFVVYGATGTGSFAVLNGGAQAIAGTSGTTVKFIVDVGLTMTIGTGSIYVPSGCIRTGAAIGAAVEDCNLQGFVCIDFSDPRGFHGQSSLVKSCSFSGIYAFGVNLAGDDMLIIGCDITGAYIASVCMVGSACTVISSRMETSNIGIILGVDAYDWDAAQGPFSYSGIQVLDNFTIESITFEGAIVCIDFKGSTASGLVSSLLCLQTINNPTYGIRIRDAQCSNVTFTGISVGPYDSVTGIYVGSSNGRINRGGIVFQGVTANGGLGLPNQPGFAGAGWTLPTGPYSAITATWIGCSIKPSWTFSQLPPAVESTITASIAGNLLKVTAQSPANSVGTGQNLYGPGVAGSTQITNAVSVTIATSAPTASGNVLTFGVGVIPASVIIGMLVNDNTAPGTQIAPGTTVSNTSATTITLSAPVNSAVGMGDSITIQTQNGQLGSYTLNNSQTVASETMFTSYAINGEEFDISDGLAAMPNCADGTCTTFGTAVTAGGGALSLKVRYNGAKHQYTLIGI